MGKKKGSKKKGSLAGDEDSESAASVSTLSSLADIGFDESASIEDDPFEASIDALYEKRATTRERGLLNLVSLFTAAFNYEEALVRKDTLSTLMLNCIKKGGVVEAALACRGIALLLVTLGASDEAESLQQDAHPVFEQAACYGKTVAVKAAAIESLAITAFVASNDPHVVEKCMTGFANLWKSGPSKVATAAIRGWSLLLSTVPAWRMTTSRVEMSLQSLAHQLHSEDVEVRAAAGEAIALLYHTCGISDLESFLEDQDESDASSSPSPPSRPQHTSNQMQIPKKVLGSPATHMPESQQQIAPPTITSESNTQPAANTPSSVRSTASQAEALPRQLSQDDSELATAEPSSRTGLDESSASAEAADAAAVQAHLRDDHHTNGHASASDAGPATSSPRIDPDQPNQQLEHFSDDPADVPPSNPSQHRATSPTSRSPNLSPGAVGSSQEGSRGNQGRSKSSARNPKQQAEAISNGLDDVVSRMKALATNKGDKSRRSRRDRATTRSTFRDLCSVVEQDGSVAQTKIKLRHGDTLIINTLVGSVQLNAFRRFLAEGFQTHLQHNPLLHQVFEFEPQQERAERLTPLEKKLYRSPVSAESKNRTQRRNHDRAAATAYKGAMMSED